MVAFGWRAGLEQYGPGEALQYAAAADEAGFDLLAASDQFHPWNEAGQSSAAWTWLGAAAVKTRRIHLGTGVTCPILRYHPAVIAQSAQTLAVMAPGRVFLTVGTGQAINEYAASGDWPGFAERQERLAEAVDLIRELWTGETVSFNGLYYQTNKAKLFTRSDIPVPLYISAMFPGSAYFAGLHGDGFLTKGGLPEDVYRQMIESFDRGAEEAGRHPRLLPKMINLLVSYSEDEQVALEATHRFWAGSLPVGTVNQRVFTPLLSAARGKTIGMDVIRQHACISADPQKHIEYAQYYIDLGFTHLFFHSAGPDQLAFIRSYAQDVLPAVREMNRQKISS
jgi:coenzyme F420-dependent glucose-6-phosphate dehydrogenase